MFSDKVTFFHNSPTQILRAVFLGILFGTLFGAHVDWLLGVFGFLGLLLFWPFLKGWQGFVWAGTFFCLALSVQSVRLDLLLADVRDFQADLPLDGPFVGWVCDFPEKRRTGYRYRLCLEDRYREIVFELQKNPGASFEKEFINGENLRVLFLSKEVLDYGDRVIVSGKLQPFRSYYDFDTNRFWQHRQIAGELRGEIVILGTSDKISVLKEWAYEVREQGRESLMSVLPTPQSQIAMGIMLGVKHQLPVETEQDFRNSGLMHIVVVSGFNVSIVLGVVALIFRRFGPWLSFGMALLGVTGLVLLAGGGPPVLRAGIMGVITAWAIVLGRWQDGVNVLLLSGVLIAIFWPLTVQFDLGFWLSFVATMGILLWGSTVVSAQPGSILNLRTILWITLVAQLWVTPILAYFFGEVPILAGFVANLLVEPMMPMAMLLGGLSALGVDFLQVFTLGMFDYLVSVARWCNWGPGWFWPVWLALILGGGVYGVGLRRIWTRL